MAELITKASDGTIIKIAVANGPLGAQRTGGGAKVTEQVTDALEEAKKTIVAMSQDLVGAVKSIDKKIAPDEFTLEFGLKFTVDGSVIIASASAEASLQITMKYSHSKETV